MAYNAVTMRWHRGIISLALLAVIASPALAQTTRPAASLEATVAAHLGWGQMIASERWNPLLVTVAAPRARAVVIEISQEDGPANLHRIRQHATAGPIATVYALVCPLATSGTHVVINIRDAETDATLASIVANAKADQVTVDSTRDLIAVSGSLANWPMLHDQLTAAGFESGALQTDRLPYQAIGYDGVTLLILDAMDFRQFNFSQQSAILQWISAGGCLLVWPGLDPLPPSSPLTDVLPATLGEAHTFNIAGQELPGRLLAPKPEGRPLIVSAAVLANNGCIIPYGLGSIAVVPMDLSKLQFDQPTAAVTFWQPLLASMANPAPKQDLPPGDARQRILDDLQTKLPASPASPWQSLLPALAIIFLVIGPLDSILLFANHRPPRNWLTLTGWLGTVACVAALVIGQPPTPPRVLTLRVIDQTADGVVAANELIAIRPGSQTSGNLPTTQPAASWRTFPPISPPGTHANDFAILDCQQDQHGTWIDHLWTDADNTRFAQSDEFVSAPPIITASLTIFPSILLPNIDGSITNHGRLPLQNIRITSSLGQIDLPAPLLPGQTQNIADVLTKSDPGEQGLSADLHALNETRTRRISRLLATESLVCIEAIQTDTATVPQRRQVVRAVLPLSLVKF